MKQNILIVLIIQLGLISCKKEQIETNPNASFTGETWMGLNAYFKSQDGIEFYALQDAQKVFTEPNLWNETKNNITGILLSEDNAQYGFSPDFFQNTIAPFLSANNIKIGFEAYPYSFETHSYDTAAAMLWITPAVELGLNIEYITPSGGDNGLYVAIHKDSLVMQDAVDMYIYYENHIQSKYPTIKMGEIFPYNSSANGFSKTEIFDILDYYKSVVGHEMQIVHIEPLVNNSFDYNEFKSIIDELKIRGIISGVLHHGINRDDNGFPEFQVNPQEWYNNVLTTAHKYHDLGINPDKNIVQSWLQYPERALPETLPYTFTNTVRDFNRKFKKK